jgi:hypothetical protein
MTVAVNGQSLEGIDILKYSIDSCEALPVINQNSPQKEFSSTPRQRILWKIEGML